MAASQNTINPTIGGSPTGGLDTGTLEVVTTATGFSETAVLAKVTMKAHMVVGTPDDGDYVDVFLLKSVGDPDGSGSFEFPGDAGTDETAEGSWLARLDVYANNPARLTKSMGIPIGQFKLYGLANGLDGAEKIDLSFVVMEKLNA